MTGNGLPLAGADGRLLLAVPSKGRMAEPALELCQAAGLRFETTERSLHVPCLNAPVDLLLVRPHDIPEYVQDGVVHLGITGANLIAETRADVLTMAELGFARCTLEAAVPDPADHLVGDDHRQDDDAGHDLGDLLRYVVQVQDQEGVIKKAERGAFADAFALQPGFTHQLFHLQFARHGIDVLTADDSNRLLIIIDAKIVACGMSEVFLQIGFLLGKGRHEAFTDRGVLEPLDDFADDRRLQRPERYMLNRQSLAFLPLILHGIEREDVVVVLNAFAGLLLLRHEVVKQVRRDSQDFVLPDTIVDEFVVKALGDQSEHLVALLFEDRLFIILFAHTSTWLEFYGSSVRHLQFGQRQSFAFAQSSFDFGNKHLGFGRQTSGNRIEGAPLLLPEQVLDAGLAGVVGGQCQSPVAEAPVKAAKILGGGASALLRLQALVGQ